MSLLPQAINLSCAVHAGQTYGTSTYFDGHIMLVLAELIRYECCEEHVLSAGVLHDVVEDTDVTIEQVRAQFGDKVADLVWAVTGVGKNRRERNQDAYAKISAVGDSAATIKLADRIVNVRTCWKTQDPRLFMYQKEHPSFRQALGHLGHPTAWDDLDNLLGMKR